MKAPDNRALIAGVAAAAAVATFHGAERAAAAGGVAWGITLLYPVMLDGLAVLAFRQIASSDGWRRVFAWFVMLAAAGASGSAQAYVHAKGRHGGDALLGLGMGAAPALIVLLATILGSPGARRPPAVASAPADQTAPAESPPAPPPAASPPAAPPPPLPPATEPAAGTGTDRNPTAELRGSGSGSAAGSGSGGTGRSGSGRRGGSGSGAKVVRVPAEVRAAYAEDPTLSGARLGAIAGKSDRYGRLYKQTLDAEREAGVSVLPEPVAAGG